jgi:hypothetical protein
MFKNFTELAVLHFVLKLDADNAVYSVWCQVKPALTLLERLAGRKDSVFSPLVDTYIEATKRRAAEAREPAKKAPELPPELLEELLRKFVKPHQEAGTEPDLSVIRTLLRVVIVRYTICRFNCYNKLRVCDVEDRGDCFRLTFVAAKNDQMQNGSISYIVQQDAVAFIRYAFLKLGFVPGNREDKSFLNCVIKKVKGKQSVVGERRILYSHVTSLLQKVVAEAGFEAGGVTDKSFKMQGVTSILDSGVPLEDVMHHGRWRTLSMPLHYKVNSEKYKKDVAKNI